MSDTHTKMLPGIYTISNELLLIAGVEGGGGGVYTVVVLHELLDIIIKNTSKLNIKDFRI